MPIPWELILGPAGVAVLGVGFAWLLWRDHLERDKENREVIKTLTASSAGHADALRDLTDVVVDALDIEAPRKARR